MKLWPRRIIAASEPTLTPERGASGTVNLGGYLQSSELNASLIGRQGLTVFRQMIDTDAAVQEAIEHLNSPIKNATWTFEPPDDPSDDELLATALCQASFFEWLDQPWSEHLDSALEYLALGHSVFEVPWQIVEANLNVPRGHPAGSHPSRTISSRQWLVPKRFAPRSQETIWRWNSHDGDLQSITQMVFKNDSYVEVDIPSESLLVLTHKKRGDEYTGKPIIRAAYKAWSMKNLIEKVSVVAIERHGVGIPVAYPAQSAANNDATLNRLEEILQNLRAGAFSYVVMPGPKLTSSNADGYLLEILSPSSGIPDFTPILEYQRGEIKAAVLARFAELGHASVGARATGDTQSIVWFAALNAAAQYVASAHDGVVKQIVDSNIPGVDRYPKLHALNIESRNLQEFADSVSKLVVSGAIRADDPFRAWARDYIGSPEEDGSPDPNDPNTDGQGNPIEPTTQPTDPTPPGAA
jgi:hypothetical protein